MGTDYVHGYSVRESERLADQASTLTELLHADSIFPAGAQVLEAGCGVGSQTVIIAQKNPSAVITSIDVSDVSLAQARQRVQAVGLQNVGFRQADVFALPFAPETYDQVFVCFVLEHLRDPLRALENLKRVLKPGGTIVVIEGDHGSAYFSPRSEEARAAIQCQITLQARAGGNALIGRELYPLLRQSRFEEVRVSPRMVYVDATRPHLVDGFTRKTFTAMIEGVRERAIAQGLIEPVRFDQGIRDLYRTCEPDGTFCYTFFKAWGTKPG